MQNIFKKIGDSKEILNENDIFTYFYFMRNKLKESFDLSYEKNYTLKITYSGDDDDVVFNEEKNEFQLNLGGIIEKYSLSFEEINEEAEKQNIETINKKIIEKLNIILSEINLNYELATGDIAKISPEFYICAINESYLNNNIKPVRDNYLRLMAAHYTSEILENCITYKNGMRISKNMYDVDVNNYILNTFFKKKTYYPLETGIINDSTPESPLMQRTINDKDLKDYIINKYGRNAVKYYSEALDNFIKRGYLRISNTIYSHFHCSQIESIEDLNNNSLFNKLLFGQRLTDEEKNELLYTTNTSLLEHALDKSIHSESRSMRR